MSLEIDSHPLEWLGARLEGSIGDTIRYEDATQTLERRLTGGISLPGCAASTWTCPAGSTSSGATAAT